MKNQKNSDYSLFINAIKDDFKHPTEEGKGDPDGSLITPQLQTYLYTRKPHLHSSEHLLSNKLSTLLLTRTAALEEKLTALDAWTEFNKTPAHGQIPLFPYFDESSVKQHRKIGEPQDEGEDKAYFCDFAKETVVSAVVEKSYDDGTVDIFVPESEVSIPFVRRCFVCFQTQDPHTFVCALVAAIQRRNKARALMEYNLAIDAMPSDGSAGLSTEKIGRILARTVNSATLQKNYINLDSATLLKQVGTACDRAANKMVFDLGLAGNSSSSGPELKSGGEEHATESVPLNALAFVPPFRFVERFESISTLCFHGKLDALAGLASTHEIILGVFDSTDYRLLLTEREKSLPLQGFQSVQRNNINRVVAKLKNEWTPSIKQAIRSHLDWNFQERNREVFLQSTEYRLLQLVDLKLQDSLREHVTCCLASFVRYVGEACDLDVDVISSAEVRVVSKDKSRKLQVPLFVLSVIDLEKEEEVDEEGEDEKEEREDEEEDGDTTNAKTLIFGYDQSPDSFASGCSGLIQEALNAIQEIVQVKKLAMDRMYWSKTPLVRAVNADEPFVHALTEQIESKVQSCVSNLFEYLETLKPFRKTLNLDVEEQISLLAGKSKEGDGDKDDEEQEQEEGEKSLDIGKISQLLNDMEQEQEKIQSSIPTSISLGVFAVDCQKIKLKLLKKLEAYKEQLLALVAKRLSDRTSQLLQEYSNMNKELCKFPHNIEELVELENYMGSVPKKLDEIDAEISTMWRSYELLDARNHKLGSTEFAQKWRLFGGKKMLEDKIEVTTSMLEKEKLRYAEIQKEKQEDFIVWLDELEKEVNVFDSHHDLDRIKDIVALVDEMNDNLKKAHEDAALFNARETLFGEEPTDYERVEEIAREFQPYDTIWSTIGSWLKLESECRNGAFKNLNHAECEKAVTESFKNINRSVKHFQKADRPKIKASAEVIKKDIEEFKPLLPMIEYLCNPGMCDRHWSQLSEELGCEVKADDGFSLQKALDLNLQEHLPLLAKVAGVAAKEFQIEQALDKMEGEWENVYLQCVAYKNTGTYVLKGIDELMAILDEHVTMTQALQFSQFKGPFVERIDTFDRKLTLTSEVLEVWIAVQRNWLYLQPIFDSPDINKQLPAEGKRFSTVDKNWRQALSAAKENVKALDFCADEKLLEKFTDGNILLDLVSKGLSDYLETKRAGFSRFYFLSNDELLEILSETKDPAMVQPHLKKCFEGIKSVEFDVTQIITHMKSAEGEIVELVEKVNPEGKNVEAWMTELEDNMKVSVKDVLYKSILSYPQMKRTDWLQVVPGQCALNGSQFHWTREIEESMDAKGNEGVGICYDQQVQQINDMVVLVRSPDLKRMARMTISALTVIDVHARDVVEKLFKEGVKSKDEFLWISQMRYYWEGEALEGDLKVMMVSSKRPYGYEYLGNSFRLVITPLTDKCYLTLMGALQMILGGAPAGPAGTGKTETTKDLAKALAKQCVVFNCSDGLDYIAMGKFFKGLASCGAWACFDEFNRIDVEVLSVVAQQIMTLQGGVIAGKTRIVFEGTDIKLSDQFAVFITMNPGYAGRTELPDNLKARFRPVAMMVPDYGLIGEIMLYSFGYEKARLCAQKMVATFRLCSEQLSAQSHYDYGMRAVKTVIVAAGNLRRDYPDEEEETLLLRALQDVNLPKFLAHDLPLFTGIISDLFPGRCRPSIDYGPLKECLRLTNEAQGLQNTPWFIEKQIQLYETIVVRHGLMLVGPTGGGKSRNCEGLDLALGMLKKRGIEGFAYERVHRHTLNPKSITMGQLYGQFDPNTHEWQDGILAYMVRSCAKSTTADRKWVVFDGPVDAIWIENMNTVLDDNKKLCLNSGEIIALSAEMTMMFEVEDLEVASPATVSRVGIIYMEPTALGNDTIINSWLEYTVPRVVPDASKEMLLNLFESFVSPCFGMLRHMTEPVPTVNNNLLASLLRLLDGFFAVVIEKDDDGKEVVDEAFDFAKDLEALFFFSFVWSMCCTVNVEGRKRFDSWLRTRMDHQSTGVTFPRSGLVYDYKWEWTSHSWVPWMNTVDPYQYNRELSFAETIIPTSESVCYTFLLNLLVQNKSHVLMTGPTGTGKTVNINRHLSGGMPEAYIPLCLTFSAQTSANQTQDTLDSKMEKRRKGVFGPPSGKHFVVFVDDLNMPKREEYFAQPPIELLRQWFTYGGWYDRKTLTFREIIDCIMVAAMGPPGGGRNPVTPRMLRHYNIIGYTLTEAESMKTIFGTILSNFIADGFDGSLPQLCVPIVQATTDIYFTICKELLPTPSKSHYTFNMRDMGKVFQGMLMASSKTICTPDDLIRLWVHECRRVFKDRLVNGEDRAWFDGLVSEKVQGILGKSWEAVNSGAAYLVFGNLLEPDSKQYIHIEDEQMLLETMIQYLDEHNAESKTPMNLKLFMDAIEHTARISRVIAQPMGNALLLGVGGSGRKSLSKLAAYVADFKLFQIEIAKGYGLNEWREDIKSCLLDAGVENRQVVFLFDDTQIVMEQMLEDVNGILNSGDVPNIYPPEDMEKIMSACRGDCVKRKIPTTKLNVFSQFIMRVKSNVHVIICMSPGTPVFRDRLRMFPALVNCCTIDWFSEWPDEALRSVGFGIMQEVDLKIGDHLDDVVELFKVFHQSVADASKGYFEAVRRYNYVTPTSYLELLNTFKTLIQEKRAEVGTKRDRIQVGLDKLISTSAQVADLQVQLTEMQPTLQKTQVEVEAMIVQITKDKAAASETQAIVEKEAEAAGEKAKATQAIADDAQRDLDKALPALDEAVKCLNKLKKSDIDEVRSLKKPPTGVKLTMDAACIMFEIKPTMVADPDNMGKKIKDYWDVAQKKLLSDPTKFLAALFNYDKDNIADKVINQIQPYIDSSGFQPKEIEKASKACTAICMWVHAMYTYHFVAKAVEPKRVALAKAEADLAETNAKLQKSKDTLQGVMDKIQMLEDNFKASNDKKEKLANDVEQCSARLDRAQKLIGGLGSEKDRWTASVKQFGIDYVNLLGDVLIASGSIAYLGPFTADFRQKLVLEWHEVLRKLQIPHTKGCDLVNTLGNPVTIRSWQIAGLPGDQLSTENAIVMAKARRWPLLIDPQTQANRYIKNLGNSDAPNGLEVTKPSNKNFLRSLENGVRFGKWVLLENVSEKLDAALEPILLQQVFKQDGQDHIKIGDNTIPYSDTFRFFMTTKLPNPHYQPEVAVKVSLLNFSITRAGLEEQLLGLVMANELPDLEQKKNELVVQNAAMAKELQDIESRILYMLSNSKGNILDDAELIETLATSKKTSKEINLKVAEAKETEKELDSTRELYRPFAYRGSILFFCIADLRVVDPMYEYSLQWFNQLFAQGILTSEPDGDVDKRLVILKDFFTYLLYENVCRSLFEAHKLLFAFNMCIKIMQGDDLVDPVEWRFLLSGQAGKAIDHPKPSCENSDWVTDKMWAEFCTLSSIPAFEGFEGEFEDHIAEWRELFDSERCHEAALPGRWDSVHPLGKMLVLRCLRPDKMTEAIQNFLTAQMGKRFIEPPPFDMKKCYDSSIVTTPLIFLLTSGSDPTKDFFIFAESQGMDAKTKAISLGQGQGPIAARMIEEGLTSGAWILLQNCHLCSSWMDDLEAIVEDINPESAHEEFRLWLTSMPTKTFPVSVLQNGVKMTKEPPKGMRANLKSAFYKLDDSQLLVTSKPTIFMKLLYGLCFFHALIQERRKFGPLGWNIPYEFNDTDLDISQKQLQMYLDMYEEIPYDVLNFLTSYINYGGRVTDAIDLRVIDVILKVYYNEKILEDDYSFSSSGIYMSLPVNEDAPQRTYLEFIDDFPVNAEPEVFSMHNNANITCALNETYFTFDTLVLLQPRSSGGGERTREEVIYDDCNEIEARLPPNFDIEGITMQYPVRYEESMNTVLCQEAIRYQKLLVEMKRTLFDIQKALKGLVVMSSELESMGNSIFTQKVPEIWQSKAYPSMKPLKSWVQELLDRLNFINTWIREGIPPCYWISGFYFPQAFLTGTLQNYARKHSFPIDTISFGYEIISTQQTEITEAPEDGCYVYGLFMEGARFDLELNSITDSRPKELYTQLPVLHFVPVKGREFPTTGVYRCPVYKILSRQGTLSTTGHSTNFVMWIEIPSNKPTIKNNLGLADQDVWIKAGVAAFCSLKF